MRKLLLHKITTKALFLGALVFIVSCKNDIQQANNFIDVADSTNLSGLDVELTRSIKGNITVKMLAKEVKQIDLAENTYEFPQGLTLFMYDSLGNITSQMSAGYSIYYDKKGIWEAKHDVNVHNEKGDQLNTEYLMWNRNKEKIETNKAVKISTKDGIIYGDGMVSDQYFKNWEVVNGRGIFNIENE